MSGLLAAFILLIFDFPVLNIRARVLFDISNEDDDDVEVDQPPALAPLKRREVQDPPLPSHIREARVKEAQRLVAAVKGRGILLFEMQSTKGIRQSFHKAPSSAASASPDADQTADDDHEDDGQDGEQDDDEDEQDDDIGGEGTSVC